MTRPWLCAFALACGICGICDAKVINAEAGASYASKLQAGVAQALQWMSDMVSEKPPRAPRTVKLAVVGLGRTGSTSFATALKELGYAPVHDDEIYGGEVSDLYGAMVSGTMSLDDINTELGKRGFDAPVVSVHGYVEWAARAPDVKVILTVRDKKRWAESWLSVTPAALLPEARPFRWVKSMQGLPGFHREIMMNVPSGGHPELYEDIPTLEAGYDAWVDFVTRTVPKERLLVFDVRQGWGPLCGFLGRPVPTTPFPHINDRVVVDTIIKAFVLVTWVWPLVFASPLLLLWYCARRCCGRSAADGAKKRA
jgi:hypothetical protein